MMPTSNVLSRLAGSLGLVLLLGGCDGGGDVVAPHAETASCVGCHTDITTLKLVASPDTTPPASGCGGDAPHIEPYDRVFMGGPGFEQFSGSVHGRIECTACHGGIDGTGDKLRAHSDGFTRRPSTERWSDVCAHCHSNPHFQSSLHAQGWGQKNSLVVRMGASSFDELPAEMRKGYDAKCGTCHASTCGDCHVTRPIAGGGGLLNGHAFSRTPDMRDNCTACHSSRGGHAYFGVGPGTQPDVHLTMAGYSCTNCHSKEDLHGDGRTYQHRYQARRLPTCQGCHDGAATSNAYHQQHVQDLTCQTCHSQVYNNCGSCHIGGEGARIGSYLDFKIGHNPLQEVRPFRFALVRRTLAAPDSWSLYGVPVMTSFDAKPTFNFTTPHNLQRWTPRTRVAEGESCWANCHLVAAEDGFRNRELYLFRSDLVEPWEISANVDVVVDGRLPAAWGAN